MTANADMAVPGVGSPAVDEYAVLFAEVLRRHNQGHSETDIRSAVRDFILGAELARPAEVNQEESPTEGALTSVDMVVRETFIEFKRNLFSGSVVNPAYVKQLDGYLAEAVAKGRGIKTGLLTDGKRWILRSIGDARGDAATELLTPPIQVFETPQQGLRLYEWLRDVALTEQAYDIAPTRENLGRYFGDASVATNQNLATLRWMYDQRRELNTVRVKRRLWGDLLRAALGEVAGTPDELDDLFVRHTYLSAVIGMAVQASFGINIYDLAAQQPSDLLKGERLKAATGLSGIIESDFFAWPTEVSGGDGFIRSLAQLVSRFDWRSAPPDIAANLYQTVIPADERRQLGEYYTPDWLARAMVRELIADPLKQRVLDPACGSGTFIVEAVAHFMDAAGKSNLEPKEVLDRLRSAIVGIDVHPAAVHLARAAWAIAAKPAINAVVAAGYDASGSVPVFLGDALQLGYRTGDMFAEDIVSIETRLEELGRVILAFPMTLVEQANTFDSMMSQVAGDIEQGDDPMLALDDHGITDASERATLADSIKTLQRLHREGRNHIWAYYTRNMVRPVAISRGKVDVVIGNPPWLNYNQTASILREELRDQSWRQYGIWQGGRYASNQDVAGLFFTRSVDLYLKDGGVIGMVLPHSALQSGQYAKWRTGKWERHPLTPKGNLSKKVERTLAADFSYKSAWDLERLEPNTFFPVASCVAFAKRAGENSESAIALASTVERWEGETDTDEVRRVSSGITDTSLSGDSPYADYARQGAPIRPRRLFFVDETENTAFVQAGQTITVNPRRGSQDKAPWRDLDLTAIMEQTIESRHIHDVYLNESLVPYAILEPLKAVLPVKRDEYRIPFDVDGPGGIRLGGLERLMRGRWRTINRMWKDNKAAANKLNLLDNLDHYGKLSSQLEGHQRPHSRPIRIIQSEAGVPTAAILADNDAVIDETLYWITCRNMLEAYYLLAIINSDVLYDAVQPLMAKGQFGARHLHKQLWKLPIPEFDLANALHQKVARAGAAASLGASERLTSLRAERGTRLTVTIARRELRAWLRNSEEGAAVEGVVKSLLLAGNG